MKRLSLLFLLPIWVLLGCGDDEAIMLPTECAGASNFVVDFRPRVWLSENRIWLTDKDEKTEVGESLTVDGIILSFLSFNGACENTYNFNYGYARPATPSSGIVELSVEEVAAVPSGNIIDLASAFFFFYLFSPPPPHLFCIYEDKYLNVLMFGYHNLCRWPSRSAPVHGPSLVDDVGKSSHYLCNVNTSFNYLLRLSSVAMHIAFHDSHKHDLTAFFTLLSVGTPNHQ